MVKKVFYCLQTINNLFFIIFFIINKKTVNKQRYDKNVTMFKAIPKVCGVYI